MYLLTLIGNLDIIIKRQTENLSKFYEIHLHREEPYIMKSTGIVRKVDELGRVVIPIELRRTLGIAQKDALEIYVDEDKIILKKYMPNMTCSITGTVSDDNLSLLDGKLILSPEGAEKLIDQINSDLKK